MSKGAITSNTFKRLPIKKVLGFYEKDASLENPGIWIIRMEKLVPVNLKSESVTVKWLEKEIKEHLKILDECDVCMEDSRVRLNLLLSAVQKQKRRKRNE